MHRSVGTDPLFFRILAGTDGSARGEEAVRQAARFAAATGADLDVAYVAHHDTLMHVGAQREAKAALAEAGRLARKEDVAATEHMLVGDPASALCRHASEHWCDLICVGADGGPFERRQIGRVAIRVVRAAPSSVLVSRWPADESARFPSRVVCAVDGSPDSAEAARQAAGISCSAGSELQIFHAVSVESSGSVGWMPDGSQVGFEPLAIAELAAREVGVDPVRRTALGRPGPAIVDSAADVGADLIVMGSRGLHGIDRMLLGSVSEWVARHASCSVLVARPRKG